MSHDQANGTTTAQIVVVDNDARHKLSALVRWAASSDCPLKLPGIFQGLVLTWLPVWASSIDDMQAEDLDRAAGHVVELAERIRDPSITVDQFDAWLPRTAPRA